MIVMEAAIATRAITLVIDGRKLDQWVRADLTHDLSELSASYELTFRDETRSVESWDFRNVGLRRRPARLGQALPDPDSTASSG